MQAFPQTLPKQKISKHIKKKLKVLVIRSLKHQQSVWVRNRPRNRLTLFNWKELSVVNSCDLLFLRVDDEKVLLGSENRVLAGQLDFLLVMAFGISDHLELLTDWNELPGTALFNTSAFFQDQIPAIAVTKVLNIIFMHLINFKVIVVPDDWQYAHLSFGLDQHVHVCHSLLTDVLIVFPFQFCLVSDRLIQFQNDRPLFGRFGGLNSFFFVLHFQFADQLGWRVELVNLATVVPFATAVAWPCRTV